MKAFVRWLEREGFRVLEVSLPGVTPSSLFVQVEVMPMPAFIKSEAAERRAEFREHLVWLLDKSALERGLSNMGILTEETEHAGHRAVKVTCLNDTFERWVP